jgi:hypothetical protein
MIDNIPITLIQMFVGTEDRKFRHKAGGCSEVFTLLLKTFRGIHLVTENLSRISPRY